MKYPAFKKLILLAVLSWFALGFFQTLAVWRHIVPFPGSIDFTEGVTLYEANQLREGHTVYTSYPKSGTETFIAANFGPMFYLLNAAVSFLGPDSYTPHRILSLFGVLLIVLSFAVFSYRQTGSWVAVCSAVIWSIWPFSMIIFGPSLKPDSLALGFIVPGLLIGLSYLHSRRIVYSVPFFVMAFLIKQTSIAAPSFIALLLLAESRRRFLLFVGTGTILALASLALFGVIFGLQNFFDHFLFFNLNQQFDQVRDFTQPFRAYGITFWPAIILSIASALYIRQIRLLLYPLLATLLHLFLMSKAGSYINYWTEPLLALLPPVPLAVAKAWKSHSSDWSEWAFLCVLLYFTWFDKTFYLYEHPSLGRVRPSLESIQREKRINKELTALFSRHDLPLVYALDPAISAVHRKEANWITDDPFLTTQHIQADKYDESMILDLIRSKKIDYILIDALDYQLIKPTEELFRITERQVKTIRKYYRVLKILPRSQYYFATVNAKTKKIVPVKLFVLVPKGKTK